MSQRNEALFENHGVSPEHTPEQAVALGNAMLIALGSGGRVSSREMEELVSIAKGYGATPEAIAAWKRFDYAKGKISDQIQLTPRLARHMLYEAIRICSAGAPPGPVAKLAGVAGALGTEPGVLEALQAVVMAEDSLRDARSKLTEAGGEVKNAPAGSTRVAFATIGDKERDMRRMRLSTMATGKPAR